MVLHRTAPETVGQRGEQLSTLVVPSEMGWGRVVCPPQVGLSSGEGGQAFDHPANVPENDGHVKHRNPEACRMNTKTNTKVNGNAQSAYQRKKPLPSPTCG